ncbi:MAG: hypothetical protein U1E65_16605 [Myxococcota bacterium]
MRRLLWLATLFAACGGPAEVPPPSPLELAAARFPDLSRLHEGVIQRSCGPNRGVCHNSSNYPELSTVGALNEALGAPCNLELPDPRLGWNACERAADRAVVGSFRARLAQGHRLEPGVWSFLLDTPAVMTGTAAVRFEHADGGTALDLSVQGGGVWTEIALTTGSRSATVSVEALIYTGERRVERDPALAALILGDPNGDGIWGATPAAHLLSPGDLDTSYLWQRLIGGVPGTKMPLANAGLSLDELQAIACWIQSPGETIRYQGCPELSPSSIGMTYSAP